MVHTLLTGQGQAALPANWGPPSGATRSVPLASRSVPGSVGGSSSRRLKGSGARARPRPHEKRERPFLGARRAARRLVVAGGARTWRVPTPHGRPSFGAPCRVYARQVRGSEPCDRGAFNRAAELGIGTEDPRFPVVRLEKWVHPEFVQGIASGARVPLKGAAVLRVTLLEGKTAEGARAGPEIFVRCKIAARGSSDGHGLILGGRALDCAAGLGQDGPGLQAGPGAPRLGYLEYQDSAVRGLLSRPKG